MKSIVIENSSNTASSLLESLGFVRDITVFNRVPEEGELLSQIRHTDTILVLLDVSFLGIRAFRLGEQLRSRFQESLMLLYLSDTENHMAVLEAIRTQRAAYVIKPFSLKDLEYAIDTAQLLVKRREKRIFARTFGHFELFVDGKPVIFNSSKAKELLALLVDRRGGIVTSEQAIGTLWEYRANDEASRSLYSKVGKALTMTLEKAGIENLVMTSRGMKSIDVELLDCDFYQLMEGDPKAKRSYFGRYMMDYSWAEYRIPVLNKMCQLNV